VIAVRQSRAPASDRRQAITKSKPQLLKLGFFIEPRVFGEEEAKILQNLMKFQSIQVKSIMTPAVVAVSAEESTPIEERDGQC